MAWEREETICLPHLHFINKLILYWDLWQSSSVFPSQAIYKAKMLGNRFGPKWNRGHFLSQLNPVTKKKKGVCGKNCHLLPKKPKQVTCFFTRLHHLPGSISPRITGIITQIALWKNFFPFTVTTENEAGSFNHFFQVVITHVHFYYMAFQNGYIILISSWREKLIAERYAKEPFFKKKEKHFSLILN